MDCSTPGFAVHHQLPELAQTHAYWVGVIPFSSCPQSFPALESFPMSQFFASGGQSIGASTSASVLPMNIQDWFPLGWTSLISLQSNGLSRVFSNTTVQKHRLESYRRIICKTYSYFKTTHTGTSVTSLCEDQLKIYPKQYWYWKLPSCLSTNWLRTWKLLSTHTVRLWIPQFYFNTYANPLLTLPVILPCPLSPAQTCSARWWFKSKYTFLLFIG